MASSKKPKPKPWEAEDYFWHGIVYGDPGTGKSTFLATLPKPLDVALFDAKGKDTPYWQKGEHQVAGGTVVVSKVAMTEETKVPYRTVMVEGKLAVRINYFHEPDLDRPNAFSQYLDHLAWLQRQVERGGIVSHALDSVSSASLVARMWSQFGTKRDVKDPRQWYAEATELMERVLMITLPGMACHVGVACHILRTTIESEGTMIRAPLAPGRLGNNSNLSSQWPEMYRARVMKTEGEEVERRLQTQPDGRYMVHTQIQAPNNGRPVFEKLWVNWNG
jgi:hypothetical protein